MKTYQDLLKVVDNETLLAEFIITAINAHKGSEQYKWAEIGEAYDKQQNTTIMRYRKLLYTISGQAIPDNFNANHKLPSNFYNRFNVQENQYLLGNGASFENEETKDLLGTKKKAFDTVMQKLGKMRADEWKAVAIFVVVLILWATDKQHGINQTAVAFMGAVVALLPGIGVVKWNDVDIPWHLLLFSAGAYTLGAGLDATGLPGTLIDALFNSLGITAETPFWVLYLILTAGMLLFSLIFQSKTMLTLIFVPIAIGVAQKNGYPIMSLAFPVAMLVGHVYVLPFNSKPAALLYTTNQYSWSDTFKFGITMMFISWLTIILWGETVLKWFGYTSGVFF